MSKADTIIEHKTTESAMRIKGVAGGSSGNIDTVNRTINGIASTVNIDRHDEIVLPSAFAARAQKFLASNAPFLASHQHATETGEPAQIGWVTAMRLEADKVVCTFKFAQTDLGEQWWKLASDPAGKGVAFSIGFMPLTSTRKKASDLVAEFPEIKATVADSGIKPDAQLRVYTGIELYEISAVAAPSNRESVQLRATPTTEDMRNFSEILAAIKSEIKDVKNTVQTVSDDVTILRQQISEQGDVWDDSPPETPSGSHSHQADGCDDTTAPDGGDQKASPPYSPFADELFARATA